MSGMQIRQRSLTDSEAKDFVAHIKHTPNIIGYLPKELTALKTVIVIEDGNQAQGFLAYIETDTLIDLKILIIKEKFRGQGLGSELFAKFNAQFSKTSKPIYTVTRNKVVIEMLEQAGFVKTGLLQLPLVCVLHQLKMLFSIYRAKEYIRKLVKFHGQDQFSYYIKVPVT